MVRADLVGDADQVALGLVVADADEQLLARGEAVHRVHAHWFQVRSTVSADALPSACSMTPNTSMPRASTTNGLNWNAVTLLRKPGDEARKACAVSVACTFSIAQ